MVPLLEITGTYARRRAVVLCFSSFGVAWLAGLFALDHVLSRPDRIAAEIAAVEMVIVGDGILRFEHRHGGLPATLDELVPRFVRENQIVAHGRPVYVYNARARTLVQSEGRPVAGLFRRTLAPERIVFPPPDLPVGTPAAASAAEGPAFDAPLFMAPLAGSYEASEKYHPIVLAAMPKFPPRDAVQAGLARVPRGPDLEDPPAGAIVFEAEHFTETNYGWEVREDPETAGGAFLIAKEGIANGPGQIHNRMGNFYYTRATREQTYLRYHFNLPEGGRWHIYGRFMATDTKCSNYINVGINRGGPGIGSMGNRTPFRWRWADIGGRSATNLPAGDHFLHLFIHEDGVKLDQFIISPVQISDDAGPFRANYVPGHRTEWRQGEGPAVHLSMDKETMVITRDAFPRTNIVLRRLRDASGVAFLRVTLKEALDGGGDAELALAGLDLESLPELTFVPVDFSKLDPSSLPRREYLLRATLETIEGGVLASAEVPLWRHWDWRYFGPGRFLTITQPGPLDGSAEPEDRPVEWKPFEASSYEHFSVMDFGLQVSGNSRNPREFATVYAETMIEVPEGGEYLFKMMADDQMLLWLNGKLIYRHPHTSPVTRAAYTFRQRLEAGQHTLRFRLNNYRDVWQAYLRVRTLEDDVSGVIGLDWPEASAEGLPQPADHGIEPRQ